MEIGKCCLEYVLSYMYYLVGTGNLLLVAVVDRWEGFLAEPRKRFI